MISLDKFLIYQPSYPDQQPTDRYYCKIANLLLERWNKSGILVNVHESLKERVCLNLVGYYQDVISDSGLWHAFIDKNRDLYNRILPYQDTDDEYIYYELNPEDVHFMVWYALTMQDESRRLTSPMDPDIVALAREMYEVLDENYEEAPTPIGFNIAHELEVYNPEDNDALLHLTNWLFMRSWLLTPAFAYTLNKLMSVIDPNDKDYKQKLLESIGESINNEPTGPLALFVREWLFLIVEKRMPSQPRKSKEEKPDHKWYQPFVNYTGGKEIMFFKEYAELNRFLIDALGWEEGEHLQNLKEFHNFVAMINRENGLLLAHDVAHCLDHPDNPYYDKDEAKKFAIYLLTVRGLCPPDLLKASIENGWLHDAAFPGNKAGEGYFKLDKNQSDFTARCYLQLYYRGD